MNLLFLFKKKMLIQYFSSFNLDTSKYWNCWSSTSSVVKNILNVLFSISIFIEFLKLQFLLSLYLLKSTESQKKSTTIKICFKKNNQKKTLKSLSCPFLSNFFAFYFLESKKKKQIKIILIKSKLLYNIILFSSQLFYIIQREINKKGLWYHLFI